MNTQAKLYIIVREDLIAGLQAAQACHALREFAEAHPELDASWHKTSKTLVLLGAADEVQLEALAAKAEERSVAVCRNREPDLGGSLTSIACGPRAKPLVRSLPLLLAS